MDIDGYNFNTVAIHLIFTRVLLKCVQLRRELQKEDQNPVAHFQIKSVKRRTHTPTHTVTFRLTDFFTAL